jgi:SPP1 family predicted phage head-tail adaptor
MRSGDLLTTLVYQEKGEASDGAGGYTDTWADADPVIEVPAEVRSLSAKEQFEAGKHEHEITHRIFARWRSGVTTKGRFRHYDYRLGANRYYDIISIIEKNYQGQNIEILATEVNE